MAALEDGGAGNQDIGAGGGYLGRVLWRDAAVDLDVDRAPARHRPQIPDLVDRRGDERLAAESGIDRHDQDEIHEIDHRRHGAFGCSGIERDPGLLAERADRLERAVEMRPRLDMHRDDVRAGLSKGLEIRIARRDHQMHVHRLLGMRPERLHHVRPDRDVGHEVAVHHVYVDPVGAGLVDRTHFLAEPSEVGGQDRWRYDERPRHRLLPNRVRLTCRQPGGNVPWRAAWEAG